MRWCGRSVAALMVAASFAAACGGGGGHASLPAGADPTGRLYWSLALADLDGDGGADLVGAYQTVEAYATTWRTHLVVERQAQRGAFGYAAEDAYLLSQGTNVYALAVGDLDGDRRPDVVVAECGDCRSGGDVPSRVLVYRQEPGGRFALALTLAAGRSAQALALGDVNADGRPDIVVGGLGGATLLRHATRDGLEFEPAVTCGRTQYAARAVRIADVDRDGLADLVVADGSQVQVLLQDRAGFPILRDTVAVPTEPQLMDFVLVDLDGDGFDDLVSLAGGGTTPVASAAGVAVRLRDPAAPVAFRAPQFHPTGQGAPVHSWRLAVADLDRDGAADVVVANDASQTVQVEVFLQDAAARGRLRWHSGRLMGGDTLNVLAADVDGDGLLDLVAAGSKIAVARQAAGTPLAFGAPIDVVR